MILKKWCLRLGILAAVLCALGVWLYQRNVSQSVQRTETAVMQAEPKQAAVEEDSAYESPVDFNSLQKLNPDIYAWLYIPGTEINYPILQREGEGEYYLTHDSSGNENKSGAVFSQEEYNSKDFSDIVTILYGHRLKEGGMFSDLQPIYSSDNGLKDYSDIVIYLPDEEIHYTVFAAVPFENYHILHYVNFESSPNYRSFLQSIFHIRDLNASVNEDIEVTAEDRMLILSTCLQGDADRRYLVLAKRASDRPTIQRMESN